MKELQSGTQRSLRISLVGLFFFRATTLPLQEARFYHEIFGGVPADFVGSVIAESAAPLYLTVLRQEVTSRQPLRFQLTSVPATPVP